MLLRRRLMMAQQNKMDLLEGYRRTIAAATWCYKLGVEWLTNDTVRFYHTSAGFMGPNNAAICFIGEINGYSTVYSAAMLKSQYALKTLEYGKKYKLTLTVLEITKNTATTDNDGTFTVALGMGGGGSTSYVSKIDNKFSELEVGKRIELIKEHSNTIYPITSACFAVSNPALLWDIKFKVEFEEVK